MSQTELARRAGMTQPGVSRVEPGDTTPDPSPPGAARRGVGGRPRVPALPPGRKDDDALRAPPSRRRGVTVGAVELRQRCGGYDRPLCRWRQ
ncbi:helix-turn-helix domain-containing protein [Kitasatospora aureofaciens]|uniref:helix-turn-helix domain-containing protein n=1 Tax=Kitasatospora aureofaciens TaxID=1894 RepID=UPI0037CA9D43